MNRIYQGRVTCVETPNPEYAAQRIRSAPAKRENRDAKTTQQQWKLLPDWQTALWQHHQLFQDAVNYYTLALAAMAAGVPGWAGEYSEEVQKKWDDFTRHGETRRGLRRSLARTLGMPESEASFKACTERILSGFEVSEEARRQLVEELFPDKKGKSTIQHAGTGDWPMLCWKDWEGESKSEKRIRKEWTCAKFLTALFRCPANEAAKLAADFPLDASGLTSLAKGRPDLDCEKAKEELERSAELLAGQLGDALFFSLLRKYCRLKEHAVDAALHSLRAEIRARGASFSSPPWTGGNKDMLPIRLFLLFKFAPSNPLTMPALKACLRKQYLSMLRRTVKPWTLGSLKKFLRTGTSGSAEGDTPHGDAIRAARGQRGFVFPAFTAISGWGVQPGQFAWKNFDMAAFEEAIKAPHQARLKNQERQKQLAETRERLRLMEGKGGVCRKADNDDADDLPGFSGDERIAIVRRIVENDLFDEDVGGGAGYGLHERTLRGYAELRRAWNEKVQPGEPYSKEKHEELDQIRRRHQTEHRDDAGDARLFAELLKPGNWCVWQTPTSDELIERRARNHSDDPLSDFQHYLELKAEAERLKNPISFTPADAQHSPRQFYFSEGAKFSSRGEFRHERKALAFTTQIALKHNGLWKPVRVRISYTAPRLRRDALREGFDDELESSRWVSPLLQALGISEPKERQDLSSCAVSLMPHWHQARPEPDTPPDALLLNFPIDLECVELQRAIYGFRGQSGPEFFRIPPDAKTKSKKAQGFWNYQFRGRKESKTFFPMWLSWPHEGPEAGEFRSWHEALSSFRCLAADLGQRDAGAFARLRAACEGSLDPRSSRFIGQTAGTRWRAAVERAGLFRLPGEDAIVWREKSSQDQNNPEDSGRPFAFREELWGERGRPARPWEADETAELMRLLEAVETDGEGEERWTLLPENWRTALSFPEQNDKLLIALRRYQSRISRLHRWCWFLRGDPRQQNTAVAEIDECDDRRLVSPELKALVANRDPRGREQLESQLRQRLDAAPRLLVRIANRILPLRGRSWRWEKHSRATDENPLHHLTQNGPKLDTPERPVWLRGQRGLSFERIEQLEELRKRCQSLNQALRRNIGGEPPIRRDESVPDPCPDLLEKLDNLKEQRVNQTAHLILAEALGLRLAPPPPNKSELRAERDQHGVYEKLLNPQRQWIGPVDFIVIEDLSRYRASQGRAPRENSRLMKWCHRAVRDKLKQLCEVFGLPVLETPAAYSSRFCSRSGVPGFRAVEVTAGFTRREQWAWLAGRKGDDGQPTDEARRLLDLDRDLAKAQAELERDWKEQKRSGRCPRRTLLVPSAGGPVFVPICDTTGGTDLQPALTQADLNAAINLGLRAIADPQLWSIHPRLRTQPDATETGRKGKPKPASRQAAGEARLLTREKRKFGAAGKVLVVHRPPDARPDDTRQPNFFADYAGLEQVARRLAQANREHAWLERQWTWAEVPGQEDSPRLVHSKSFWGCVKAAQWRRVQDINDARLARWKNKLDRLPD